MKKNYIQPLIEVSQIAFVGSICGASKPFKTGGGHDSTIENPEAF